MSMLWAKRYRDIIAEGRVNSPCCAPDGSRSSRIIVPATLMCQIPVTNCLIASDVKFTLNVFKLFGNMPLWSFTVHKISFSLKCTLIHIHKNIYISITMRFKIPARHTLSCRVLSFCQLQD